MASIMVDKKSIKLTNQTLEQLNFNEDSLIRRFCKEIVGELDSEEFVPSWFVKDFLYDELKGKVTELKKQLESFYEEKNSSIKHCNTKITENKQNISMIEKLLSKANQKRNKLNNKIIKASSAKKSIFLCIITLGIYGHYTSKSRLKKLNMKG